MNPKCDSICHEYDWICPKYDYIVPKYVCICPKYDWIFPQYSWIGHYMTELALNMNDLFPRDITSNILNLNSGLIQ